MLDKIGNEALEPETTEVPEEVMPEEGKSEVPKPEADKEPEETPETLKSKISDLETINTDTQTKLNEALEGIKVHQRGSVKAREELQRIQDMRDLMKSQGDQISALSAMVAEFLDKSESSLDEETPTTKRGKYTEKVQSMTQESAKKAMERVCTGFEQRAVATGISMDDPRIKRIEVLVTTARTPEQLRVADELLKELEAEKKPEAEKGSEGEPKKDEPKETEEQRIDRLVGERLHQAKIEAGLLEAEPAGITGSGPTSNDELDAMPMEQYANWRAKTKKKTGG